MQLPTAHRFSASQRSKACGTFIFLLWSSLFFGALAGSYVHAQTRVDNTATATLPAGVTTNGTNNSVSITDTDIVLRHTKTVLNGPTPTANPNQYTITYRIRVENNNPVGSTGLPNGGVATYGLTDAPQFAAGVTINSVSTANSGAGVPAGGVLTPTAGPYTLAPAGTTVGLNTAHQYDLTITYTVGAVAAAQAGCIANTPARGLFNRSTLTPAGAAANSQEACASIALANLGISKVQSPASPVLAGAAISYSIVVSNAGPSPASNAVLTDAAVANLSVTGVSCGSAAGSAACPSAANTTVALLQGAGIVIPTLPSGGSLTFTASIAPAAGTSDPDATNNSASDTASIAPVANLGISKTNSVDTINAGATTTYLITVTNAGPSPVTGAILSDPVVNGLSKTAVVCSATPGQCITPPTVTQLESGSYVLPTLTNGQSYQIAVTASVTVTSGNVSNLASVTVPAGTTDPSTANNTATDTDAVNFFGVISGSVLNDANGLVDNQINGSGTDAGSASLTAYLVNSAGTVVAVSDVAANGSYSFNNIANGNYSVVLSNTAGVNVGAAAPAASLPPGWINTAEGNTQAGDSTVNGVITAVIVNNAGVNNLNFGIERLPTATSITASSQSNPGGTNSVVVPAGTLTPADAEDGAAVGIRVTALPSNVTSITLNGTTYTAATFPAGGVIVPAANIATISVDPLDGGVTVVIPYVARDAANQESAAVNASLPFSPQQADLVIQKNGPAVVSSASVITYTLTVSNAGPGPVAGATVTDIVPAQVSTPSVTCGSALGGAACGTASNYSFTGNALNAAIANLPSGGSVVLTITGNVVANASSSFINTATVNPPAGVTDPVAGNNSSSVSTTVGVVPNTADVSIVKTGTSNVQTGGVISYQLTVVNAGPGPANGTVVTDNVPSVIGGVTTACMAAGGAICPVGIAAGNTLNVAIPVLPSGGQVTLMLTGTAPSTPVQLTNTADVILPASITDPVPLNNTSSASTTVTAVPPQQANLVAIKTGPASVSAGGTVTYTVFVSNNGPVSADGAVLIDTVPAALTAVTTSCTARNSAVCPAVPAGNAVNAVIPALPAGGELVFTITGTAPQAGSFSNSAVITPPAGVNDPEQSNNTGGPVITQILATGIAGTVWRDTNRDGVRVAAEPLLAGVKVQVSNAAGTLVGSATTDANGIYLITGLAAGAGYSVTFDFGTLDRGLVVPQNSNAALNGTAINQTTISNITLQTGTLTLDQNARVVDPAGVVYDSVARTPIAGATVILTGPNGQPVPASQLQPVTPNNQVTGAAGSYIFLLNNTAPSGTYSIRVTPPAGYLLPNAALGGVVAPTPVNVPPAPGTLFVQAQAGPPAVGAPTTYHLTLNNLGPAAQDVLNNHIPLDRAVGGTLLIEKVPGVPQAELGDVVSYTIRVSSPITPAVGLAVSDRLPPGFVLVPGSVRVDGVSVPDPQGAPGPALQFNLGNLLQGGSITLTYRVRIGVGAAEGDATNRAQARAASGGQSAVATAKIRVTRGVFTKDACVIGKVYVDCNGNSIQDREELGIPGVRLLFSDGTFVVSDVEGKYSYCGLSPKTHGLKVDPLSMPRGSRLTTSSNRNALDPNSLFIDLKAGELHRADFLEGSCSDEVLRQIKARRSVGEPGAAEREGVNDNPLIFRSRDGLLEGNQTAPVQREGNPGRGQVDPRPLPQMDLPGVPGEEKVPQ
jgi:uncharacterized repeat protein (TIGR01451 family)